MIILWQSIKTNILRQIDGLQGIQFETKDYRTITDIKNWCIYLDPPYSGVKKYENSKDFNYIVFWEYVRNLSKDNIVLVSEQNAPPDFECIWSQTVNRSIKATNKSYSTEKLFRYAY